jgi:hypothetical protein
VVEARRLPDGAICGEHRLIAARSRFDCFF